MRGRWGAVAALLVAAPVLVGIGYALLGALGLVGVGAGLEGPGRIARVLREAAVWEGLAWSLWVAGAATTLATLLAAGLAALFRASSLLHRLARSLVILPLPVPHLVAAVSAVLILGQSGLLARLGYALGMVEVPADVPALIYDPLGLGLILTLTWKEVPFLALVAFALLAVRGAALEETARSLGASPWQAFRRVTWPMLWRGMMPSAVAVFVFAFGSYETALLLAPSDPLPLPVLTLERYTDPALERRGDAYVLVLLTLAVGAAAVAAHEWIRATVEHR